MYGRKKYGRDLKPVVQPVADDSSVPTFQCGRCHVLRTVNTSFSEFSLLENNKLFCYTKLCSVCTEALKAWIKQ